MMTTNRIGAHSSVLFDFISDMTKHEKDDDVDDDEGGGEKKNENCLHKISIHIVKASCKCICDTEQHKFEFK